MTLSRKAVATLAAVSMVAILSAQDQTVVATALPHILSSLSGAALLGWVFTAYFVGATATVAVVGKLADLFGRRTVFLSSIALFSAASLLCGVAVSMPMLVAFRGLQGVGAGAIQTSSLIVMGDMFPPRERARWRVINSIGFATASAVGPSVGGLLADNFSWRRSFSPSFWSEPKPARPTRLFQESFCAAPRVRSAWWRPSAIAWSGSG